MTRVWFSPSRVWLIAGNTWLEAVRQKVFTFLAVLAIALVAGAQSLRVLNFGTSELKFICDIGFGALTFFGSILAIVVAAQLFFSEVENRTVLTMLAKPVLRSEFLLGKFLGILALLLGFTTLVGGVLLGVLWLREGELLQAADLDVTGPLVSYSGLLTFFVLQWLKFGIIAVFTLLIASYAQTMMFAIVMAFFALVICHLQYLAQDAWTHAGGFVARLAAGGVALVFPNFQLFNVGDRLASGGELSTDVAVSVAIYAIAYIGVFLALAVVSFRRREI